MKPSANCEPAGIGRHFGAMGVAVEDREQRRPAPSRPPTGIGLPQAAAAPITTELSPMPSSTKGRLTPPAPSRKPTAIMPTKLSGTSHSARPPSTKAKTPTATMHEDMVETGQRMEEAGDEADLVAVPGMGKGGGRDRQQ